MTLALNVVAWTLLESKRGAAAGVDRTRIDVAAARNFEKTEVEVVGRAGFERTARGCRRCVCHLIDQAVCDCADDAVTKFVFSSVANEPSIGAFGVTNL
jgi:hypothetical protein